MQLLHASLSVQRTGDAITPRSRWPSVEVQYETQVVPLDVRLPLPDRLHATSAQRGTCLLRRSRRTRKCADGRNVWQPVDAQLCLWTKGDELAKRFAPCRLDSLQHPKMLTPQVCQWTNAYELDESLAPKWRDPNWLRMKVVMILGWIWPTCIVQIWKSVLR